MTFGTNKMNVPDPRADRFRSDAGYIKLALLGLCIVCLTAAISQRLPAQAAGAKASHEKARWLCTEGGQE